MIEKITKYKKYIILAAISLLSILVLNIKYLLPKNYGKISEVKLKEINKKNDFFAIMVEKEDNNYEEYKSEDDTWPGAEYIFKEAKCVNSNGDSVEDVVTFANGKATLTTNQTIYCTLYFDYKGTLEILRENDPNKILSNDIVADLYRYQGTGKQEAVDDTHKLVDNNYICFGTTDKNECIEKEDLYMYRIIGITSEGQLKLIKKTAITEGNVNVFTYNDRYGEESAAKSDFPSKICPHWPDVLLFKRLNGLSNGNISASGKLSNNGNTDIFIDNPKYDYLKSGDNVDGGNEPSYWYGLIDGEHEWLYGDITNGVNGTLDGETFYGTRNDGLTIWKVETGQLYTQRMEEMDGIWKYVKYKWNPETDKISAKIGLMYEYDYYLAYDNVKNWFNVTDESNWIFLGNNQSEKNYEHLITSFGFYTANNTNHCIENRISDVGGASAGSFDLEREVRPVFYLINSIQISGTGKIDNPYMIEK